MKKIEESEHALQLRVLEHLAAGSLRGFQCFVGLKQRISAADLGRIFLFEFLELFKQYLVGRSSDAVSQKQCIGEYIGKLIFHLFMLIPAFKIIARPLKDFEQFGCFNDNGCR